MGIPSGNAGLGLVRLRCEASQEAAAVSWVWGKESSSAASTCSQPGTWACGRTVVSTIHRAGAWEAEWVTVREGAREAPTGWGHRPSQNCL